MSKQSGRGRSGASGREIGVVKKYSEAAGHGFIAAEAGTDDVYVSIGVVQHSGITPFGPGLRVSYRKIEHSPGKYRATDLKIATKGSVKNKFHQHDQGGRVCTQASFDPERWFQGVITWFDPGKGYGFVRFSEESKDAYLPQRIFSDLGMNPRKRIEDHAVKIKIAQGQRPGSLVVTKIAFLQPLSL